MHFKAHSKRHSKADLTCSRAAAAGQRAAGSEQRQPGSGQPIQVQTRSTYLGIKKAAPLLARLSLRTVVEVNDQTVC